MGTKKENRIRLFEGSRELVRKVDVYLVNFFLYAHDGSFTNVLPGNCEIYISARIYLHIPTQTLPLVDRFYRVRMWRSRGNKDHHFPVESGICRESLLVIAAGPPVTV